MRILLFCTFLFLLSTATRVLGQIDTIQYKRSHEQIYPLYDESYSLFSFEEDKDRHSRKHKNQDSTLQEAHTIVLKKGNQLIYRDTLIDIKKDTIVFIPEGVKYRISKNTEAKANSFYTRAKVKAEKHWWTQLMFNSIISYEGPMNGPEVFNEFKESQVIYYPYEGKEIAQIHVKQVDILEGTVDDTTVRATTLLAKLANKLHTNTWERIIRNNLLVESGEPVFSYLVADNERLIRQLPYILDCRILVVNNEEDSSKVDVWVITEDKFSLGGEVEIGGPDNVYAQAFDQNIGGTGHEVRLGLQYFEDTDPTNDYRAMYSARNIAGSFTDLTARYRHYYGGSETTVDLGRGFVKQFTKYAFGASGGLVNLRKMEMQADSSFTPALYTYNYQDGWFGRQFVVGDKMLRKSLIFIARAKRYDVQDRPYVKIDSNVVYHNYNLYMGGITFKRINYYKNNFINRFGVTEDIPHGYFLQYNFGYEDGEFKQRFYNSVTLGFGYRLNRIGYTSFVTDFGMYLRTNRVEQAVYRARFTFLANLIRLGRHKIRNSCYATYISGINRSKDEVVNIENKLKGLAGSGMEALQTTIAHYEIVDFTPWNIYGFRAALAVYAEAGWLQAGRSPYSTSDFFQAYGVSLRIRNESLAIKSIELSFSYYPTVTDQNKYYIVDFSTSSPGSQQLDLPLVPGVIPYTLR